MKGNSFDLNKLIETTFEYGSKVDGIILRYVRMHLGVQELLRRIAQQEYKTQEKLGLKLLLLREKETELLTQCFSNLGVE